MFVVRVAAACWLFVASQISLVVGEATEKLEYTMLKMMRATPAGSAQDPFTGKGRELDTACSTTSCGEYDCDTFVRLGFTCAELEDDYGCSCTGCSCSTTMTCFTVVMEDSYGDGWDGAGFDVYNDDDTDFFFANAYRSNIGFTFSTGYSDTAELCLEDGCYRLEVGGGNYDGEISWTFGGVSAGAPFSQKFSVADGSVTFTDSCTPQTSSCCSETCSYAGDDECDDGGPGADFDVCEIGTDCADCGVRQCDDDSDSSSGGPAVQYHGRQGWCGSWLDYNIDDTDDPAECWANCVAKFPETVAIDMEGSKCYCQDDCVCIVEESATTVLMATVDVDQVGDCDFSSYSYLYSYDDEPGPTIQFEVPDGDEICLNRRRLGDAKKTALREDFIRRKLKSQRRRLEQTRNDNGTERQLFFSAVAGWVLGEVGSWAVGTAMDYAWDYAWGDDDDDYSSSSSSSSSPYSSSSSGSSGSSGYTHYSPSETYDYSTTTNNVYHDYSQSTTTNVYYWFDPTVTTEEEEEEACGQLTQMEFCNMIDHPVKMKALNERFVRDDRAEDMYELMMSNRGSAAFAQSHATCDMFVRYSICLDAFPPCDCSYLTACSQTCIGLNHCADDVLGFELCDSCDNMCSAGCEGDFVRRGISLPDPPTTAPSPQTAPPSNKPTSDPEPWNNPTTVPMSDTGTSAPSNKPTTVPDAETSAPSKKPTTASLPMSDAETSAPSNKPVIYSDTQDTVIVVVSSATSGPLKLAAPLIGLLGMSVLFARALV